GNISVSKTFYQLNWPAMMLFSGMLYYFLSNDNKLDSTEGLMLFGMLLLFLIILLRKAKKEAYVDEVNETLAMVSFFKIVVWLLIGGIALFFGSHWLVKGAIDVAQIFGVSEAVISVSVIAIGTSVPELAASVIAAAKHEKSISLGNLIGSNIFNIGSVLGLTSMIKTIEVTEPEILTRDIFWMIAFSAVLVPLILIPKKHQITRVNGFMLTLVMVFL
ncbi:sodium:calcium antiporter, partial [Flavobacteriaceae bacterium]|nr:sodium:calcium antiporter [Flavobacteriaceae bacterium]